uniref:MFS domain-containing protein n=1 Tax=Caenorhabditis tropicalis TaxID=1561998 RepID=A0A1I7TUV0_9PELO
MGVYVTIFLYALTTSVFFPVFQSLIFYKACISLSNHTDAEVICQSREAAARDESVHTLANFILLTSSTGLCFTAFFTSRWIGQLSDVKSRKLAFLIPFTGLFISDFTILIQVIWPRLSPYYFIVSEVIYGVFGGYMSITAGAFAIISTKYTDTKERAKAIARLEGTISLGSMVGFLISSRLEVFGYLGMAIFFVVAHLIAFLSALLMKDVVYHEPLLEGQEKQKQLAICSGAQLFKNKPASTKRNLRILYFSFAISYFAFIGSTRILFFYLKHKFFWGAEKYGYLKAVNQGMTTVMAMFVFPALKNWGVTDVRLAIFGLATRSIGRAWYAIAWADYAVFGVVCFEMFSKFPATALRSLISSNVGEHERGSAFSLVAVIEAVCNLTSSWVFHIAFPISLKFFPELSFVIMPVIILPAIVLMISNLRSLESPEAKASTEKEKESEILEAGEASDLKHIPTETDTLTDCSN